MKKIIALVAMLALAFTLAGCGSSMKAGDTVKMGSYKKADLEWTVVKVDGDKALVVCTDEVTRAQYAAGLEDISWEKSKAREFLNGDFMNTAFSSDEKGKIVESTVKDFNGTETKDSIFVLNADDAKTYFKDDKSRADKQGGWYYLMTAGEKDGNLKVVFGDGSIHEFGFAANAYGGIRPAMWIKA